MSITLDIMAFLGTPTGIFKDLPWYENPVRDEGHSCPTCSRLLKIYHRRLSRSMARSLIRLYRLTQIQEPQRFFHVKQFDKEKARGEFGVLSSWGLVEEQPNVDPAQKTSGMWAITSYGMQFVRLEEKLPQHVILKWGSQLLGYSGPMVDARQCLEHGNRFRYDELMAAPSDLFF